MSFEIIIKSPGAKLRELRPGEFRYVLGRDGLCLERSTPMYRSIVKVDGPIPFLEEHPEQCQLHCGKIPSEMLQQMVGFFQAAYRKHGGEAALILLFYPETGRFAWHCPKQAVEMYSFWGRYYAEDSIEYENPLTLPEGAVQFGDAHSHTGPASPSLVDHNDEAHLDGLHIIVGYIKSQSPSWHIDFCMDGNRFAVPPELILEAIPESPFPEPSEEWMDQIQLIYPASYYKNQASSNKRELSEPVSRNGNSPEESSQETKAAAESVESNEAEEEQTESPAVPRNEDRREQTGSIDEEDT
jgi:hypothetical protein